MKKFIFSFILLFSTISIAQNELKLKPSFFGEMKARHIGPAVMSGRISAIDAWEEDARLIYAGAASGGVWKSTNGGTTFKPVFDDHIQSVGALAIDQKHPDTVWVGTGESWTRNSIGIGNGIYKTVNGGEKWEHLGLDKTDHISKIIINPKNTDVVYVAALGNVWAPNEERGLFKTNDGGKTWNKILYIDENTGCADIAMDPSDPQVLFAGMWDFRRQAFTFRSGGKGSGLYKSEDSGNTWREVTNGLPEGEKGRIAVAFSPVNPNIIYALIESEKTGLYRSLDKGITWELRSASTYVSERPFYFSLIIPDRFDTNRIYKPGLTLYVSDDGGYSFTSPFIEGGSVHSDMHALWINPKNKNHIYLGTDGGLYISDDHGSTWRHARNLPVSQFYHVSVDLKKPYNVYGGLQDNGSWAGPSKSVGGIENRDWQNVGYGDGFNVIPDLNDDNVLYWQYQGGNVMRFYKDNREIKEIRPFSTSADEKLRFNWDTPIYFSPTQKNVMYIGAQFLFKSNNSGDTWEKISPDLTTNDPGKQKQEESGGLTVDNSTAENHCTVITISESPKDKNIIWVGTDDGYVQVTGNGGKSWKNRTKKVPGLPENTWCSSVYASNHSAQTAFAVFDGHRNGDKSVYVFRTTDLGETWTSLASENIEGFARVIREDFVNPDLLFLGTEFGLYVSIDTGKSWVRFEGDVPKVPIYDMVIHPTKSDLVIASHGRGILIIDDITPLRQLNNEVLDSELTFLESEPFIISNPQFQQSWAGDDEFVGRNPGSSAIISYYMKKRHVFGDMFIEIFNPDGKLVQKLPAGKNKGINRVPWVIRKKPPKVKASSPLLIFRTAFGPTYPPGVYTVKITKGNNTYESKFELKIDPDSRHSEADRKLQIEYVNKTYDLLEEVTFCDNQVTDLKSKLLSISIVVDDEFSGRINKLTERLETLHKELVSTHPDRLSGEVRLAEKIGDVYTGILSYEGRPTDSQIGRYAVLEKEFQKYRKISDEILEKDLTEINRLLQQAGKNIIEPLKRTQE